MHLFNPTSVDIWEFQMLDDSSQLPPWLIKVLYYLCWIVFLPVLAICCFGQITRYGIKTFIKILKMLKDNYPYIRDNMQVALKSQRMILDGCSIMFYTFLIRPIYCAVLYLFDIIGYFIVRILEFFRYIYKNILPRLNRNERLTLFFQGIREFRIFAKRKSLRMKLLRELFREIHENKNAQTERLSEEGSKMDCENLRICEIAEENRNFETDTIQQSV